MGLDVFCACGAICHAHGKWARSHACTKVMRESTVCIAIELKSATRSQVLWNGVLPVCVLPMCVLPVCVCTHWCALGREHVLHYLPIINLF